MYSGKEYLIIGPEIQMKALDEKKGLIFDIQHFSIHDGPGIRTTVFMKGCPLRCKWCSNPESWNPYVEIMVRNSTCIDCKNCEDVCPSNAITVNKNIVSIDRSKCSLCYKCAEICPTGSLSLVGKYISVSDTLQEVEKDKVFYDKSGGGMTISGGEPLVQGEFIYQLMLEAKKRGLHCVLDTSGYQDWEVLEQISGLTDLILYDIKHLNTVTHKKLTGKGNRLILNNIRRLTSRTPIWLRVPLIPGYNDSHENMQALLSLAQEVKAEKISLLPYHILGKPKYKKLGRRYNFRATQYSDNNHAENLAKYFNDHGIKTSVG